MPFAAASACPRQGHSQEAQLCQRLAGEVVHEKVRRSVADHNTAGHRQATQASEHASRWRRWQGQWAAGLGNVAMGDCTEQVQAGRVPQASQVSRWWAECCAHGCPLQPGCAARCGLRHWLRKLPALPPCRLLKPLSTRPTSNQCPPTHSSGMPHSFTSQSLTPWMSAFICSYVKLSTLHGQRANGFGAAKSARRLHMYAQGAPHAAEWRCKRPVHTACQHLQPSCAASPPPQKSVLALSLLGVHHRMRGQLVADSMDALSHLTLALAQPLLGRKPAAAHPAGRRGQIESCWQLATARQGLLAHVLAQLSQRSPHDKQDCLLSQHAAAPGGCAMARCFPTTPGRSGRGPPYLPSHGDAATEVGESGQQGELSGSGGTR